MCTGRKFYLADLRELDLPSLLINIWSFNQIMLIKTVLFAINIDNGVLKQQVKNGHPILRILIMLLIT